VVSAVIEQVYSSAFKFCLFKNARNLSPKRFIFTSKCTKMRLVAGLRLGELTALPSPLAGLRLRGEEGRGVGKGREGKGKGKGGRRKGEDPQCLKCVDANGY